MYNISVSEASTEILLSELESRGVISIARVLEFYKPNEREVVIANGVAQHVDNVRELCAGLLAQNYAYQRIALDSITNLTVDEFNIDKVGGGTD